MHKHTFLHVGVLSHQTPEVVYVNGTVNNELILSKKKKKDLQLIVDWRNGSVEIPH